MADESHNTFRHFGLTSISPFLVEQPKYCVATDTAVTSSDSFDLNNVECRLEAKQLWDKFHDLGTEMIITKSGRY